MIDKPVCPKHYDKPITPWMLQRHMDSSGSLFIDARRTDIMEYAFRIKEDLRSDLKKIIHNAQECLNELDRIEERKQCLDKPVQ